MQVVGLVLEVWVQVVGLVLEILVQVGDLALGLALVWFLVLEVLVLLVLLLPLLQLGVLVLLGGLVLLQIWVLLVVVWVWVVDLVHILVGQVDRCLSNPRRLYLVLHMRPQQLRRPICLTILEELLEELPGTLLDTPLVFRPPRQHQ